MDTLARTMMTIVLLSSVFWATHAADGSWEYEDTLRASIPAANDWFGTAVALCEGRAAIGAHTREAPGPECGAAYMFEEGGGVWTQTRLLNASDWTPYANFGQSVALVPDKLVVGALHGYDDLENMSGSAYPFSHFGGGWQTNGKLFDNDLEFGACFGWSVARDGDKVLVGAAYDGAGSAYLFEKIEGEWTQIHKFVPGSHGAPGDCFGYSVALCGDVVLIGAPFDDDGSGSAYVFQRFDPYWVLTKLVDSGYQAPGDWFGYSVALWGDVALVGVPYDDSDMGPDRGTVCVFEKIPGWQRVARLAADDGVAGAEFGASVGLYKGFVDEAIALVGAPCDDDHGPCSGSAYSFAKINGVWTQIGNKLTAGDGAPFDLFGFSVAVSESSVEPHPIKLLIGAPGYDSGSGSAYVFVDSDCNENGNPDLWDIYWGISEDCQPNGIPDECDIADGTSDDVNGNGIPDECECAGDLDGDYDTDQADLGILLADWGCDDPVNGCDGDLNGDDKTNQADLGILLADWGCGT